MKPKKIPINDKNAENCMTFRTLQKNQNIFKTLKTRQNLLTAGLISKNDRKLHDFSDSLFFFFFFQNAKDTAKCPKRGLTAGLMFNKAWGVSAELL